jgi:hypothetical protein
MNGESNGYVSLIQQLARPTVAQTERFARYVSGAHSWYKHLPVCPKVPFVFYLDPGAGMNRVHTRTGEMALVPVTDESTRFHYTWQKTEDYRRRFGYWNYQAEYGSMFLFSSEGGVVSTAGTGLQILTDAGDWVSVPADLANTGTALVSAMVHPSPNIYLWDLHPERFGLSHTAADANPGATANAVLRRVADLLKSERWPAPAIAEGGGSLPPLVRETIERPPVVHVNARWLMLHGHRWDWPDEAWLEQLSASGIEPRIIPAVVKYVEVEQRRLLMAEIREEYSASSEWPVTLQDAILEERGRQLTAMTDAMYRLVDAIYPSSRPDA